MKVHMIIVLAMIGNFLNIKAGVPDVSKPERQLKEGWAIQSSAQTGATGDKISKTGFDISGWYPCQVPSTVMAALIANNEYPDIFMGDNISKVDAGRFASSWWFRNEFTIDDAAKNTELIFEGINYRANIWLNGRQIASADSIFGGFRMFKLNISKNVIAGKNALAVEVYHPKPDEPSIGFVDWAPNPPDREMGLWRPVKIRTSGKTVLDNIFVASRMQKNDYREADIQVSADAINNTDQQVEALIKGNIGDIRFEKKITLQPHQVQTVVFNPGEFPQLKFKNPRLWWTHDLGKPEMYDLTMETGTGNEMSYAKTTRFGIREVEDYITEHGYRGYKLNGVPLLIKGGGWVDGMFLNDTEEKVRAQMEYVKHANMNTIRLEGFWGNSERFYETADEMGLLLMVGWSCQWEWKSYLDKPELDDYMSISTPEDQKLILNYTRDHVLWLRNHPGIFVWVMASDKLPVPELEKSYRSLFAEIDPTRPLLMSCQGRTSTISGPTAVKMRGPYEYVSPNYWYIDTANGGAFGFNTETGPGPQVPSVEVLKTMIPADKLWPINEMWDFHCGRFEFQTLSRYLTAFNHRYGEQTSVDDFSFKSQASNLEAMRAMYEAFAINRNKTTGIVQWMYNSAWPKLIWQLWDYNLQPNGAFYGARLGARPVSIAYNYGNHSVYVTNVTNKEQSGLTAQIQVWGTDGRKLFEKSIPSKAISNSSAIIAQIPEDIKLTEVYFLKLRLLNGRKETIADNFYWLSKQKDVPDFKKTTWFYTPLKEYANFKSLDQLAKTKIKTEYTVKKTGIGENEVTVTLTNPTNTVAFLIELNISGDKSGKTVVPVLWDDNYISLVPGESRVVKARFSDKALNGDKPVFRFKGWNVGE